MKDFKNMSDSTVLRVRVPKALYESIKKELEKESVEEKVEKTAITNEAPKEEAVVKEYAELDPNLMPYAIATGLSIPAAVYLAFLLKDKAEAVFKKMAEKAKEQKNANVSTGPGKPETFESVKEEGVKQESTEKE